MYGVAASPSSSQISERLAAYESIRRNRAAAIQVMSNYGMDEVKPKEMEEFMEGETVPGPYYLIPSLLRYVKCAAICWVFRRLDMETWLTIDVYGLVNAKEVIGMTYGHDVVKRTVAHMVAIDPEWKLPENFFPAWL